MNLSLFASVFCAVSVGDAEGDGGEEPAPDLPHDARLFERDGAAHDREQALLARAQSQDHGEHEPQVQGGARQRGDQRGKRDSGGVCGLVQTHRPEALVEILSIVQGSSSVAALIADSNIRLGNYRDPPV